MYSVKIINPNNAGGEVVVDNVQFQKHICVSVEVFKTELREKFIEYIDGFETQFGFIIPGHGMKGKQEKIDTDKELEAMYNTHKKKKRINLWLKCKPKSKKTASPDSDTSQSKRQNSLISTMTEVDDIVTKLKEKHEEKFTSVQLNCWAHYDKHS